jgi:hypothetical protein
MSQTKTKTTPMAVIGQLTLGEKVALAAASLAIQRLPSVLQQASNAYDMQAMLVDPSSVGRGRYILGQALRPTTTKQQREAKKLQSEAELSKKMAEYLAKTGFRSLGDALAFYAGCAAPPRSEGMIVLRKVETGTSTVNPDVRFDKNRKAT